MVRTALVLAALSLGPLGAACSSDSEELASRDAGSPDLGLADGGGFEADGGAADTGVDAGLDGGEADSGVDAGLDGGTSDLGPTALIRGRFESAGPVRSCGQLVSWRGPDGFLLRPRMNTCGDDMDALAATIVANLDAARAEGVRVMLVVGQGIDLPPSWLESCETFELSDLNFSGTSCVPWDANYQARLRQALVEVLGPAVRGHPALAGVYFTITTMTNGSEMHFRAERTVFTDYPGDAALEQAYLQVMDIYQAAFDVPVVFEAGHCLFSGESNCDIPLALYTHARDTYGKDRTGVAMWNCSERFFVSEASPEFETRPLFELATADGVSIGCQTVGAFGDPCRFSSDEVADYGTRPRGPGRTDCPDSTPEDAVAACVDTLNWFTGQSARAPEGLVVRGTWGELWSKDLAPTGVYASSPECRAAVDGLSAE